MFVLCPPDSLEYVFFLTLVSFPIYSSSSWQEPVLEGWHSPRRDPRRHQAARPSLESSGYGDESKVNEWIWGEHPFLSQLFLMFTGFMQLNPAIIAIDVQGKHPILSNKTSTL